MGRQLHSLILLGFSIIFEAIMEYNKRVIHKLCKNIKNVRSIRGKFLGADLLFYRMFEKYSNMFRHLDIIQQQQGKIMWPKW